MRSQRSTLSSSELFRVTLPIVLSNLIYAFQSFFSLLFVSKYGSSVVAGVGLGTTLLWAVYALDEAVYAGLAATVSRLWARGERVGRFLYYGALYSLLLSLPAFFYEPGLELYGRLFSVSPAVLKATADFLRPVVYLLPFMLFTNALNALFNGVGKTKTIFHSTLLVFFTNLLLLLLLVPKAGAEGVGWATALSETAGAFPYLLNLFKDDRLNPLKAGGFRFSELLAPLKFGSPAACEEFTLSFSHALYTGFVARCGTAPLAAFQVGQRVESFALATAYAFLDSAYPLVGADPKRAFPLARFAFLFTAAVSASLLLLSFLLLPLFELSPQVEGLARLYLLFALPSQPLNAFSFALSGALRALLKAKVGFLINAFSFWAFKLAPAFFLSLLYPSPLLLWALIPFEALVRSFLLFKVVKGEAL